MKRSLFVVLVAVASLASAQRPSPPLTPVIAEGIGVPVLGDDACAGGVSYDDGTPDGILGIAYTGPNTPHPDVFTVEEQKPCGTCSAS